MEIGHELVGSALFKSALELYSHNFVGPDEYTPSQIATLVKRGISRLFTLTMPPSVSEPPRTRTTDKDTWSASMSSLSSSSSSSASSSTSTSTSTSSPASASSVPLALSTDSTHQPVVAAFALVSPYGVSLVNIDYCAVSDQFQGKGLGGLLLKLLLELLTFEGYAMLTLECVDSLVPFYEKYGGSVTPVKPNELYLQVQGEMKLVSLRFVAFPLGKPRKLYASIIRDAPTMTRLRDELESSVHNLRYTL